MPEKRAEMVIPREKATFWLDGRGRWRNASGVFRNRKIIDYFHSSIRRDESGYFVCQERESCTEKVYFLYEDTALFVFDVLASDGLELILNTQARIPLLPQNLFVAGDNLYTREGDERIKFAERALMKMAAALEFSNGAYYFQSGDVRFRIPEEPRDP
jgi:hypothetical protein